MASHALAVKTEIAVADCLSTLLSFLADDDEGDGDDHRHHFNKYHKLFLTFHVNMYQSAQIMPKLLVWHHFFMTLESSFKTSEHYRYFNIYE